MLNSKFSHCFLSDRWSDDDDRVARAARVVGDRSPEDVTILTTLDFNQMSLVLRTPRNLVIV